MKKQKLLIIIMVIVLAGMLAVWYFAGKQPADGLDKPQETTSAVADKLFDFKATDVDTISIINESGEITLKSMVLAADGKEELSWDIESVDNLPYDKSRLSTLASDLIGLTIDKSISDQAENLSAYGLDEAKLTVRFSLKSGENVLITVGDTLSSGDSEYVGLGERIVTIRSTSLEALRENSLFWLDRSAIQNIEYNDIKGFTFSRSRDELELRADCELVGSQDAAAAPALDFSLTSPVKNAGDDTALGNLLQQLSAISAAEYIELNPQDLSVYGLDQPGYSFEIEAPGNVVKVQIGASAGNDRAYALSSLLDAIFTIDVTGLTSIDIPLDKLIDPFVSLNNIGDVSRIEADIYGTSFAIDIDVEQGKPASDENAEFKLDGEDAKIFSQTNNTLYAKFYQSIISVRFAGIDNEAQPVNTAEATIKYKLKANSVTGEPARTQIVEFARRDDYTDYVFIDGVYTGCYVDRVASFYSDSKDSEGIITAYKMMKYAMANAVDGVFDTEKGYQLD